MQHEVGAIFEGKVTGITKFGAFVELPDKTVGMVHISEIAQTYVSDISEYLKMQQVVKVKILSVNDEGKISLSIKKAMPQNEQQGNRPPAFNRNNTDKPASNFNRNADRHQGGRDNNDRQGGYAPTGNFQNRDKDSRPGITYRPPQTTKPTNFEDMLSKFIQSSDEKNAD
ncbi:MAG: S1 RNA-binding domain-containing protein [Oscillospiraceae bacterium]